MFRKSFCLFGLLLITMLVMGACQPIQQLPDTKAAAAASTQTPLEQANQAVVQRFYDEVFTQKKMAVLGEIMDANFVVHDLDVGGELNGGAPLEETLAAFPDVKATTNLWVSEGELVTVYVTYRGTHQAEYLNVAATGAPVTWEVIDVWRVKDGKLAELWHNIPNDDILEQIAPQGE